MRSNFSLGVALLIEPVLGSTILLEPKYLTYSTYEEDNSLLTRVKPLVSLPNSIQNNPSFKREGVRNGEHCFEGKYESIVHKDVS